MTAQSVTLSPPRDPGGKGSDGRWTLNVFHRQAGRRHDQPGIHHTDADEAKAAAAEILGYELVWVAQGPSFRAANPEEHCP